MSTAPPKALRDFLFFGFEPRISAEDREGGKS
jgi:hypothetical protein